MNAKEVLTRFAMFSESVDVLQGLGVLGENSRFKGLTATVSGLRRLAGLLRGAKPDPSKLIAFEKAVNGAVDVLSEVDAAIPMNVFRRAFRAELYSREAVARYARMLVENLGEHPDRVDRVEFLLTRLVTVESGGRLVLQPRADVASTLDYVTAGIEASHELRRSAREEFTNHAGLVKVFSKFDDLFNSSVYRKLHEYKKSLGGHLLDPEIAYAAASVNLAISNYVAASRGASTETEIGRRFDDLREGVEPEARQVPETPVTNALQAWSRFSAFSTGLDVVTALFGDPDDPILAKLGRRRSSLRNLASDIRDGAQDVGSSLEAFTSLLADAEEELSAADVTIPMLVFRKKFNPHVFAVEAVTRYVSVLVRFLDTQGERRDRVEFLITRLLSVEGITGELEMRPIAEALLILEAMLPDTRLSSDDRDRILAGLLEFEARLAAFYAVDEMFESGFYAEVYEYKLGLGAGVLDPHVVFAFARLNIAISNHVNSLLQEERRSSSEYHARATDEEARIRGVFQNARVENSQAGQRFAEEREKARGEE